MDRSGPASPANSISQPSPVLTIPDPYGDGGGVNVTMSELEYYVSYGISHSINISTQIGATFILLVLLILLTDASKRRSVIYTLNILSLTCNLVRTVCAVVYYAGPLYSPRVFFTFDFSGLGRGPFAATVVSNTFTVLVLMLVEASLFFQVRVSCATTGRVERIGILLFVSVVALLALGFRFALTVISNQVLLEQLQTTGDLEALAMKRQYQMQQLEWLGSASNITTSINISVFCAIFMSKLAVAMLRQRRLGIKKFGPMQAIFIMSCQTLLVPAIFAICQYVGDAVGLSSQVLTVTVLFLPLSAMWASATIINRAQGKKTATSKEQGPAHSAESEASRPTYSSRKGLLGIETGSDTTTTLTFFDDIELTGDFEKKGSRSSVGGVGHVDQEDRTRPFFDPI